MCSFFCHVESAVSYERQVLLSVDEAAKTAPFGRASSGTLYSSQVTQTSSTFSAAGTFSG
jgi:hypothetical protein